MGPPPARRRLRLDGPLDLRRTLWPLQTGRSDPTMRLDASSALRATRTPAGPATLHLRRSGDGLAATAWGPGRDWALEALPALVGAGDEPAGFDPGHPTVARAHHRHPGLRIAATGRVADLLVPTVLAQRVTSREARRSWAGIVSAWGGRAPGPAPGLRLPPAPAELAARPYWAYTRFGVDRGRAETVVRACARLDRLEEAVGLPRRRATARLTALPGLGPWTAAILMRHARGDPDTVEVGDFHVSNTIAWNLAGEPRGTDERMLELLEPFAGQRGRVVMLLGAAGQRAPRFGPKAPPGPLARDRARRAPPRP